jgi:hypothetical protein
LKAVADRPEVKGVIVQMFADVGNAPVAEVDQVLDGISRAGHVINLYGRQSVVVGVD